MLTRRRGSAPAAALAAVSVLASSGCATIWAGIQLSGSKTYSTDGSEKQVTPVGNREEKLDLEIRSLSPLALGCTLTERPQREHVREVWHRWGFGWKMVGGFSFVAESILGTAGLIGSIGRDDRQKELIVYSYLAADALATGVLLLALEPEASTNEYDVNGSWSTVARCPDGLGIRIGDAMIPVGADGQPPPAEAAALGQSVIAAGAPISLQWGNRVEALRPTVEERCEWARTRGDPIAQAICPPPAPPAFAPAGFQPPVAGPAPLYVVPPPGLPVNPPRLRIELTLPGAPARPPPR